MKRKQTDRKLLGLEKNMFAKNKRWAIDQDYKNKLNLAEQLWLSKFNDEFYGGAVVKNDKSALHSTERLRKDCYQRNNISNRDLYSILDSGGAVVKKDCLVGDFPISPGAGLDIEDVLIEIIDSKKEVKSTD